MGLLERSSHWKSIGSVIRILYWHYFYIITNIDFLKIIVFELTLCSYYKNLPELEIFQLVCVSTMTMTKAPMIFWSQTIVIGVGQAQSRWHVTVSLRPWEQGLEVWWASSQQASDPRGRECSKRQITAFSLGPSRPCGLWDVSELGGQLTGWGLCPTELQTPCCVCPLARP